MRFVLLLAGLACLLFAAACATPSVGNQPVATPTATPCATLAPAQTQATPNALPTQATGRSNPATPLPGVPTLSPEFQATMQAQMQNANPGAPTTPAEAPGPGLPPCPTPTPSK